MIEITINNKTYKVKEANTPEEKEKGLLGVKELPKDEGILFNFTDEIGEKSFWMKDTLIPLDIIFIDEDLEVLSVHKGEPNDETPIVEKRDVAYVLELNQNSGVREGDEIEFEEDDGPVMKVLAPDGSELYELWGGERIFSRKNTQVLIRKAKKANLSKEDKDYKALGKYIFKCLKQQDNRNPEYVTVPD